MNHIEVETDSQEPQTGKQKLPKFLRSIFKYAELKKGGKRLFWAWIAYQTIKGTLTTSFIWIPLLLYYLK